MDLLLNLKLDLEVKGVLTVEVTMLVVLVKVEVAA